MVNGQTHLKNILNQQWYLSFIVENSFNRNEHVTKMKKEENVCMFILTIFPYHIGNSYENLENIIMDKK